MSQSGEQIMRRFLALWSERDAEAMAELFAADAIYDNVPDKLPMIGRDAIRAWLEMCFEHLTRIDVEVLRIASNGDWVLSERIDDHIVGERHMQLPVMNSARIVDGRIKLFRDYYDRQTVVDLGIGSEHQDEASSDPGRDEVAKAEAKIDEAGLESFPASDPPAWTLGQEKPPAKRRRP